MSLLLFNQWSEVTRVIPSDVELLFAAAEIEAGGGIPYIEIDDKGGVIVHREQELLESSPFGVLSMLAWSPGDERSVRVDYPRWFVRFKTSSSLNLGTMIAAASKSWAHLDLSISYSDLMNRGPALLLNHQSESGTRILLWTTKPNG